MTTKLTDLRDAPNAHTRSLALVVLMIQDFGVNSSTYLEQLASFHACSKNKKNTETKILNFGTDARFANVRENSAEPSRLLSSPTSSTNNLC